ncbi:MAG: hypothetical protein ABI972_21745 [Acidobacteriota bacterium]
MADRWRFTSNSSVRQLYIEHLDEPRFRAMIMDEGADSSEVDLDHGGALWDFNWIDPRPSDAEVTTLAHLTEEYTRLHPEPEEIESIGQ